MPSSSSLSYVPLFMLVVISRRGRSMISCIKLPCFFSSALYDLHSPTTIKTPYHCQKCPATIKTPYHCQKRPTTIESMQQVQTSEPAGPPRQAHGTTVKYAMSSMQLNLPIKHIQKLDIIACNVGGWGKGAYLKNMDLKKPLSMEDWFIMTESSWLYPL